MNPDRLLSIFFLTILLAHPLSAGGKELYVSPRGSDSNPGTLRKPFLTIERARDAVRMLHHDGKLSVPVTVFLRGGTYALTAPLTFLPEDGGSAVCPVSYRGYKKERPVISGGESVTGWRESTRDGRRVWTVLFPGLKSGQVDFRELWVDGVRRPAARHPNTGYLKVLAVPGASGKTLWSDGSVNFQYAPGDIPARWAYSGAEVVVMNRWVESHLPVSRVDTNARTVRFAKRSLFTLEMGDDYYIQNVPDALDSPGEWCLDRQRGELQYLPMSGEKIGKTSVVIPRLRQILCLEGDPEQGRFVEHITFEGITFSHSEWRLPDTLNFRKAFSMADSSALGGIADGGYPQAAYGVPGAISAKGVRNMEINGCEIAHVGSYGIELSRGCQGNRILHCVLRDLGAGGVKIGETIIRPAANDRTCRNDVMNCFIGDGGLVYHSGIGIWVAQSADNRIMDNTVHDFYYSGLSIGWTWGYGPSAAEGNIIENNHVHHIGVLSNGDGPILSDMAGIYTLGVQPGTVIRRNIFHDIAAVRYGGWGIYFDEGSTDILAEDNLVYRTTHGGFHQHYGKNNVVRNNIFAFARDQQIQRTRAEDHLSFTFEGNIVYWKEGKLLAGNFSGQNFRMENNIYWKEGGGDFRFDTLTFIEWQKRGMDAGSMIADPGFVNPAGADFSFTQGSAALERGFHAFRPGPRSTSSDKARPPAARRTLYNMDGTDLFFYHDTISPAELCNRVDEVADAGVTTYLFSPNSGQKMGYPSTVCAMFSYTPPDRTKGPGRMSRSDSIWTRIGGNFVHLVERGYDPTRVVIDRAKLRGLEAFITFRMNELHDVDVPGSPLLSEFWKSHPQYRVGGYEGWGAMALNYAVPEVQDYYFALLSEVCGRFDLDGLEMDFMRFPYYFPREPEKMNAYAGMMTAFIRRVHVMTEARGKERGRPILLTARVPSTLKACEYLGLDPAGWTRERLIDFLTVGPFLSTEVDIPVREFKAACPGIPVYTAIEYTLGDRPMTREVTRAAAATLFASGADGIYSFNHFCQRESGPEDFGVFAELSHPAELRGKDKLYAAGAARYPVPNVSMTPQLPLIVGPDQPGELTLQTAETVRPKTITIRIESDSTISAEWLHLALNGNALRPVTQPTKGLFPDRYWRGGEIPAARCVEFTADPALLRGKNRITIGSTHGAKIPWIYLSTHY